MKTLWLKHDFKEAAAKLKGQFADPSNASQILTESTRIIAPDGSVTAVFVRNVISSRLHLRAHELLKSVNGFVSNRAIAMGTQSLARSVNKKGIASPRRGVNEIVLDASPARQGIVGWDRPRHVTELTRKHPEMLSGNRALIELANNVFAQHLRTTHAAQRTVVQKIPWRLWNTAFTTVYVAKNFRTAYHRDGNLNGAMTAITPLGKFSGGGLVLLRWGLVIPYQPGDLLIFNAEQLHGNLPFEGERMSVALFCGRWIASCK